MTYRTIGDRLISSRPNFIPTIIEINLDNLVVTTKLLVKQNYTIAQLIIHLRNIGHINNKQCVVAFIGNNVIKSSDLIVVLHSYYKNVNDGCLHISLLKESTFG